MRKTVRTPVVPKLAVLLTMLVMIVMSLGCNASPTTDQVATPNLQPTIDALVDQKLAEKEAAIEAEVDALVDQKLAEKEAAIEAEVDALVDQKLAEKEAAIEAEVQRRVSKIVDSNQTPEVEDRRGTDTEPWWTEEDAIRVVQARLKESASHCTIARNQSDRRMDYCPSGSLMDSFRKQTRLGLGAEFWARSAAGEGQRKSWTAVHEPSSAKWRAGYTIGPFKDGSIWVVSFYVNERTGLVEAAR